VQGYYLVPTNDQSASSPNNQSASSLNNQSASSLNNQSLFTLQYVNNTDGTFSELFLLLSTPLVQQPLPYTILLRLVCYDGGSPPRTGDVMISVTILPANNHTPVFEQRMYDITVREDLPPNTPFLQVHASDPDSGLDGVVVYSLTAGTVQTYGGLFTVGSTSGNISLTRSLQLYAVDSYSVVISAEDRSVPPHRNTTQVLLSYNNSFHKVPTTLS